MFIIGISHNECFIMSINYSIFNNDLQINKKYRYWSNRYITTSLKKNKEWIL